MGEYYGGGPAPETGVWTVSVLATAGAFPTVNGQPVQPIGGPFTALAVLAVVYVLQLPVVEGKAYQLSPAAIDGVIE